MAKNINAHGSAVKLERSGMIAFLVYFCLSLTKELVCDLERHAGLTPAEIERYHVRSIPSEAQNVIISHSCLDRFGPAALLASEMFYSFNRAGSICTCLDWSDRCHCDGATWRLDVNPEYHRGLLLPITNKRFGYFEDLLVYRHVRDTAPFILRVGADREMAA